MTQKTIGIIGLGNMGSGMARTLLREGYNVLGIDLDVAQQEVARNIGVTDTSDDIPKGVYTQTT